MEWRLLHKQIRQSVKIVNHFNHVLKPLEYGEKLVARNDTFGHIVFTQILTDYPSPFENVECSNGYCFNNYQRKINYWTGQTILIIVQVIFKVLWMV